MNRPSNKGLHYNTDIDGYAFNDYVENLEKYCNELEARLCDSEFASQVLGKVTFELGQSCDKLEKALNEKSLKITFARLEKEKLEKVLDKACEYLVSNTICCLDICPFKGKEDCIDFCTNKEKWKEWLFEEDEKI